MTVPVVAVAGPGGSLITSVAANVAGLLARAGNRTLLVGTDPLGCLDHDLGIPGVRPGSVVHAARPGLDLLVLDAEHSLSEVLTSRRAAYDVVVVDGSGPAATAEVIGSGRVLVPVRPDRTSMLRMVGWLQRSKLSPLGVVIVDVPVRPRAVLARARRSVQDAVSDLAPVFVSKVRSEVTVSWSARDRGLLVHELASTMDRGALDTGAIDAVLGLARDYAELAEEVVIRLRDEHPAPDPYPGGISAAPHVSRPSAE